MSQKTDQESISFLLSMIGKAQRARSNEALSEVGLYAGQERVLVELSEQDELTQSQLVECLCVQPPTVSKMLDRMEKTGLVQRREDAEDSRITRVCLTDQGRSANQEVCSVWKNMEAQIVDGLSLEERIILRRLLLHVYGNLMKEP